MAVTFVVAMAFVLQLVCFAEGNVLTRQPPNCSNVTECLEDLNAAQMLFQRPDSANSVDQIRGNLSNLCVPRCIDLLRRTDPACLPFSLGFEPTISLYCGSGPGGERCLVLRAQEQWITLIGNVRSACVSTLTTTINCTSSCRSALVSVTEYLGCCIGSLAAVADFNTNNIPPLFAACNKPLLEMCSGASVLQAAIFLLILTVLLFVV